MDAVHQVNVRPTAWSEHGRRAPRPPEAGMAGQIGRAVVGLRLHDHGAARMGVGRARHEDTTQEGAGQVDDGAVEEVAAERVPLAADAADGAQTMFWSWVGSSGPSRPMAGISDPRSQPAMTELVRPSLMTWAMGCWALAATWL